MITLAVPQEDIDVLEMLLSTQAKSTLVEVHRTESAEFRQEIQRRLRVYESLLEQIKLARQGSSR
jgi:hypothetical protein